MVRIEMNALEGKVLAITRGKEAAAEFSQLVAAEGGQAIALQTIDIVPQGPEGARRLVEEIQMKKYDYCAFMSAQAVQIIFGLAGNDAVSRALNMTKVLAVGPETRAELEKMRIKVDAVPQEYSSKGLVKMISGMAPVGKKIVLPRSAAANDDLVHSLRSLGMIVEEVTLYTVSPSEATDEWKKFADLLIAGSVDAVIFTSATSVSAFFEIIGRFIGQEFDLHRLTSVISIGPYTTIELRKKRVELFEARVHTVKGSFEIAKEILM